MVLFEAEEKAYIGEGVEIEFITTRELRNKSGEATGKIKIIKLKERQNAKVEYTCPVCGFSEEKREAWEEPFVTGSGINKKFLINCGKCGHEIEILKLKKELKKR